MEMKPKCWQKGFPPTEAPALAMLELHQPAGQHWSQGLMRVAGDAHLGKREGIIMQTPVWTSPPHLKRPCDEFVCCLVRSKCIPLPSLLVIVIYKEGRWHQQDPWDWLWEGIGIIHEAWRTPGYSARALWLLGAEC